MGTWDDAYKALKEGKDISDDELFKIGNPQTTGDDAHRSAKPSDYHGYSDEEIQRGYRDHGRSYDQK